MQIKEKLHLRFSAASEFEFRDPNPDAENHAVIFHGASGGLQI
jgi:hypothetical protein